MGYEQIGHMDVIFSNFVQYITTIKNWNVIVRTQHFKLN